MKHRNRWGHKPRVYTQEELHNVILQGFGIEEPYLLAIAYFQKYPKKTVCHLRPYRIKIRRVPGGLTIVNA